MSLGLCRGYESARQCPRTLIVDRDRKATEVLARQLGELGWEVSYAFDARLALLYARKCRPHVAFLDVRLQLAQAFRNDPALAGCALVGLGTSSDTMPSGLDGLLPKFPARRELAAAIQGFLPPAQADEAMTSPEATVPIVFSSGSRA